MLQYKKSFNIKKGNLKYENFNASASIFGWHFQINVAIFFMLNEIQNIDSVRVEGKDEDIEFNLKTGNKIFIQAK